MKDKLQNDVTIEMPAHEKKKITFESPTLTVQDAGFDPVEAVASKIAASGSTALKIEDEDDAIEPAPLGKKPAQKSAALKPVIPKKVVASVDSDSEDDE